MCDSLTGKRAHTHTTSTDTNTPKSLFFVKKVSLNAVDIVVVFVSGRAVVAST